jgi:hypothetical protein
MAENQTDKSEGAEEKADQKIDRALILSWLKQDVQYLRKKGYDDNPGRNTTRISYLRASIYGCSVMLQALKDKEIDDLAVEVEKIKEHLGMKE